MKKIPYGMTDFETIRREDYYYVDKTRYIAEVERAGRYIFLLRPRRFGKSLFLDVLYNYYDVNRAGNFDEIFEGTYIHEHPTPDRGKYMVMKFNFSIVNPDPKMVEESFNIVSLTSIREFLHDYAQYLPADASERVLESGQCDIALNTLMSIVKQNCDLGIYIMIDEYDNFANTLLSYDEEGYRTLTHGTGFFRLFFNVLKGATTGSGSALKRLFVTGVTPLTLSDVTSGFNIGRNVSMEKNFNESIGFSESEVREMLDYYREASGVFNHTNDEIIDYIRPWYDNYCFAEDCVGQSSLYNSTMIYDFLNKYIENGVFPKCIISADIINDMNRLWSMVYDKNRDERSIAVLRDLFKRGCSYYRVSMSIEIGSLSDPANIMSLLYYHGILTYGTDDEGYVCPIISNQLVRGWTFERLEEL